VARLVRARERSVDPADGAVALEGKRDPRRAIGPGGDAGTEELAVVGLAANDADRFTVRPVGAFETVSQGAAFRG
jgi:hypothetical protein